MDYVLPGASTKHLCTRQCGRATIFFFFFTLVTGPRRSLSLTLSDTRVYEQSVTPCALDQGWPRQDIPPPADASPIWLPFHLGSVVGYIVYRQVF